MTNNLFSTIHTLLVKSKQCVFLRFAGFSSGLLLMLIKNAVWALFMCILAVGMSLFLSQNWTLRCITRCLAMKFFRVEH